MKIHRPNHLHNNAPVSIQSSDLCSNLSVELQARALHAVWTSSLSIALFVIGVVGSAITVHYLIESEALAMDLEGLAMLYAFALPFALTLLGLWLMKIWNNAMQPQSKSRNHYKQQF